MEFSQKSTIMSPNVRRPQKFAKIATSKSKIEFSKISWASRRKSTDKKANPLKMMFIHDPLNLDSLASKSAGSDSPYTRSPVIDRSGSFQPACPSKILDKRDPLNLNKPDDLKQPQRKRRKRKRRFSMNDVNDLDISVCSGFLEPPQKLLSPLKLVSSAPPPDCVKKRPVGTSLSILPNERTISEHPCKSDDTKAKSSAHTKFIFYENSLKYRYGNFVRDYNANNDCDLRIDNMKWEWFHKKRCLDIGCNTGFVTLKLAKLFRPDFIVGIDIDESLIKIARTNARELYSFPSSENERKFPISNELTFGPSIASTKITLIKNLRFLTENYVASSLEGVHMEYDSILCLNVSMWVQLNFGDDGLKKMFKKIFLQLKPGGRLLFEPQAIQSYKKQKKNSAEFLHHFNSMKLHPNDFVSYLLSNEIGFARSECLTYIYHKKSLSGRPLYLLSKGSVIEKS